MLNEHTIAGLEANIDGLKKSVETLQTDISLEIASKESYQRALSERNTQLGSREKEVN